MVICFAEDISENQSSARQWKGNEPAESAGSQNVFLHILKASNNRQFKIIATVFLIFIKLLSGNSRSSIVISFIFSEIK